MFYFRLPALQEEIGILPLNINDTTRMIISQSIPRSHRQIQMVLVAPFAGVFDSNRNCISFPTYALVAIWAGVDKLDFVATVRAWSVLGHPIRANGNSIGTIGTIYTARAQSTIWVWIDGS